MSDMFRGELIFLIYITWEPPIATYTGFTLCWWNCFDRHVLSSFCLLAKDDVMSPLLCDWLAVTRIGYFLSFVLCTLSVIFDYTLLCLCILIANFFQQKSWKEDYLGHLTVWEEYSGFPLHYVHCNTHYFCGEHFIYQDSEKWRQADTHHSCVSVLQVKGCKVNSHRFCRSLCGGYPTQWVQFVNETDIVETSLGCRFELVRHMDWSFLVNLDYYWSNCCTLTATQSCWHQPWMFWRMTVLHLVTEPNSETILSASGGVLFIENSIWRALYLTDRLMLAQKLHNYHLISIAWIFFLVIVVQYSVGPCHWAHLKRLGLNILCTRTRSSFSLAVRKFQKMHFRRDSWLAVSMGRTWLLHWWWSKIWWEWKSWYWLSPGRSQRL